MTGDLDTLLQQFLRERKYLRSLRPQTLVWRHTLATEYLRRGGDVVRLSRTLGHTQITTTMRYLHLVTDDLSAEHQGVDAGTKMR